MTPRTERRAHLILAGLCTLGAVLIGGWRLVVAVMVVLGVVALAVHAIAWIVLWIERRDTDGVRAAVKRARREMDRCE